jgi:hypothetical protein
MAPSGVAAKYDTAARRSPRGVVGGQLVAEPDAEEVVVFLIGMRVNRWRRLRSWFPVFVAMPRMLKELEADPDSGLLQARTYWSGRVFLVVQYWRSADQLGRYARDAQQLHAPAWARWNKSRIPGSGDVGIFHETYVVPREGVESRYANVPTIGLGAAFASVPRTQRSRRTRADDRVEGGGEVRPGTAA